MKTREQAEKLADEMIEIGKLAKKQTVCILTNMDEPLGYAIGNNLEVIEAIDFLKGNMPEDLKEVVLELGAYMVKLAGLGEDIQENKKRLLENISNRKGYEKFIEMVKNQNGDISYIEDANKFEKANFVEEVISKEDGYIQEINAERVGKVACMLGAGRVKKEDDIDYTVGVKLCKKVSEKVYKGETLAYIYANSEKKMNEAKEELSDIIKVGTHKVEKIPTIIKIIN